MKKVFLSLVFILPILALNAEIVGSIKFFLGNVEYKESPNASFRTATLNMPVHSSGVLRTALAAEAEIHFTNGAIARVEANKTLSISKIMDAANQKGSWNDKLKRQMKNLKISDNRRAGSVAGIRRTEAELIQKDDYFWAMPEPASYERALTLFESGQYSEAIPILEKVIEQAPLHSEAELSHIMLILIYEEETRTEDRNRHIRVLKNDFPQSHFLQDLPN